MLNLLSLVNRSPFFWLFLIFGTIVLEGIALFFQYQLDYGPCVLCVHVRAWLFAITILSVFGLIFCKNPKALPVINILTLAAAIGGLERSYVTLGVERGFIDGSCTLDSGFPTWLPLDKWLPTLFEPWEACGYTPEVLFSITMAEGLVAIAGLGVLLMAAMSLSSLLRK